MNGRCSLRLGAVISVALAATSARAVDVLWNVGTADYNTPGNWVGGNVPAGFADERAVVNNAGTAFLTTAAAQSPVAVALGTAASTSGTLELRGGASLTTVAGGTTSGVAVGPTGTGTLRVERGATLNVAGALTSGNNAANLIVLGGGTAGTATVTADSATFGGTTQVSRNTSFNATTGGITFNGTSVYTPVIEAAGAPQLTATGTVTLGGVLRPSLNFIPASGTTWNLFEGNAITGSFASINSSQANLGAGQRLAVGTVAVSPTVQRLQLRVDNVLSLLVNRNTGEVFINNPGAVAVNFDGYAIQSPSGALNRPAWNSLDAQNALGGDWRQNGLSSNTNLSELKPTGGGSLGATTMRSIGLVFAPGQVTPAPAFGTPNDVSFTYNVGPGGPDVVADVVYTGTKGINNFVLQIDPVDGKARIRNTSGYTVPINGYTIRSTMASLTPGAWKSLDDQNLGDWKESTFVSASQISELKPTAETTFITGTTYLLGNIFTPGATRDVVFNFNRSDDPSGPAFGVQGEVVYESFTVASADFDADSDVDGADFLAWQRGFGTGAGAGRLQGDATGEGVVNATDFDAWKGQYGTTQAAAPAAVGVPEPAAAVLAAMGLAVVLVVRKRADHPAAQQLMSCCP